jgi:hypothetical protein
LDVLIRADVGDRCLPQGTRIAYAEFLSSFPQSHALASHVSQQHLEPLLGRLGFAASTFRWGYLLLQNMFAALYGKPWNGLPALCPLSVVFWDEFRYWDVVLTSFVVPFGGVTRSFAGDTTLPFQLLTFDHHIFTDASTSSGWGAFLRDQVVFGPWPDLSRGDHICWLELTAIRIALFRFQYSLAGSRVLVHTNSAVALGVFHRSHFRLELLAIALLSVMVGFGVRGVFVPGVADPADAPSRGFSVLTSFKGWTFRYFAEFCPWIPDVDCFADPSGYCSRATRWFSHLDPDQTHEHDLVGRRLWAHPPWTVIGQLWAHGLLLGRWPPSPRLLPLFFLCCR